MTAVGVVAEYNPFHNGHMFHLTQTAERFPERAIVCVMSGNVVQRGSFAMLHKFARAAAAVRSGADLVFELPTAFACAPAPIFASRAVELLAATGVVDALSFGSECGDAATLQRAAADDTFHSERFTASLRAGRSYAAACAEASRPEIRSILAEPNDLLAIEYLRAARQFLPNAAVCAVQRQGAGHNRLDASGTYPSASALRNRMRDQMDIAAWLPSFSAEILQKEQAAGRAPVFDEASDLPMLAALRRLSPAALAQLPEVTEGLEYRLASATKQAVSISDLLERLKTKRYTCARLRRILMSAYIGLTEAEQKQHPAYLHLLAASRRGTELLHEMKQTARLPVIAKPSAIKKLDASAQMLAALEERTDSLYMLAYPEQRQRGNGNFYASSPWIAPQAGHSEKKSLKESERML